MLVSDAFDMRLKYSRFVWFKNGVDIDNTLIECWFGVLFLFVSCSSADVAVDIVSNFDCRFMDCYNWLSLRAAVVATVMLILNVRRCVQFILLVCGKFGVNICGEDIRFSVLQSNVG